jgi:zinc/manganese transport system substrate-binding protein
MRSNKPDFILMANYQNDKGAQWLSEKTNVPVLRLPFTVGGSEQASNLETLYNEVLSTLVNMQ